VLIYEIVIENEAISFATRTLDRRTNPPSDKKEKAITSMAAPDPEHDED
jgi:hypothetical protein